MNGHRNYEVIRRRVIHEAIRVIAPNEVVAERVAMNMSAKAWRETKSGEETLVGVLECEPHGSPK
jgi:alanine dehydrogenase